MFLGRKRREYLWKASNKAQEFAQALIEQPKTKEEIVPQELHEFLDVFEKKAAEHFPESRPWDHEIKLKEGFEPKNCKVYPLSPKEEDAMNEFIDENLWKGYIRPSKSPMASLFFFVGKKDRNL